MHASTEESKEQRNQGGLDKQDVREASSKLRELGSLPQGCFPQAEVAFSSWHRADYQRTCPSTISEFMGAKGRT